MKSRTFAITLGVLIALAIALGQLEVWILKKAQVIYVGPIFSKIIALPNDFALDAKVAKARSEILLISAARGTVLISTAPKEDVLSGFKAEGRDETKHCGITKVSGYMGKYRATLLRDEQELLLLYDVPNDIEKDVLDALCGTRQPVPACSFFKSIGVVPTCGQ